MSPSLTKVTYKGLRTEELTFNGLWYWFSRNELSYNFTVVLVFSQPALTREHDSVSLFACDGDLLHKHGLTTTGAVISNTKLGDLCTDGHKNCQN